MLMLVMGECLNCGNIRAVSMNKCIKCGSLVEDTTVEIFKFHTRNRMFSLWKGMIERCNSRTSRAWIYYGARGISVCERWMSFVNFILDMGMKPPGKSLDRIYNNGSYGPDNCRWATPKEQANNRAKYATIAPRKKGPRAKALANGEKTFISNKECKHGHRAPRFTRTGNCMECNRIRLHMQHV